MSLVRTTTLPFSSERQGRLWPRPRRRGISQPSREPRDSWIVVGADVHYDLRQPDGTTRRVLFPSRFQPGVALGSPSDDPFACPGHERGMKISTSLIRFLTTSIVAGLIAAGCGDSGHPIGQANGGTGGGGATGTGGASGGTTGTGGTTGPAGTPGPGGGSGGAAGGSGGAAGHGGIGAAGSGGSAGHGGAGLA